MPELPDVQYYKSYVDATALHQRIDRTEVRDSDMVQGITARGLARRLKGRKLRSATRHGKYLFLEVADDGWLALHFGMTGRLEYVQDTDRLPDHTRFALYFHNGHCLAFDCQCKLGSIAVIDDPQRFVDDHQLGPDALSDDVDLATFRELMDGRRGSVKAALMKQETIAGIGNVYSDEILFRARIRPTRNVSQLDDRDIRDIYRAMRQVLPVAAERHADPDRMPRSYLMPQRHEGGHCPRCRQGLTKTKVSGRGTYFCKRCQK